jgi:hypothetical protein
LGSGACRFAALACSLADLAAPADSVLPSLAYGSHENQSLAFHSPRSTSVETDWLRRRRELEAVLVSLFEFAAVKDAGPKNQPIKNQ